MLNDHLNNTILYNMQTSFPLQERPFLELSQKLDIGEDSIIKRVKELKDEKIIRQTSAIFDTKRLGYKSSLVAFRVKEENIEQAVVAINAHPGVSHNYLREHDFNIWFTIAVAPDSKLTLEQSVDILREQSSAEDSIILPTTKMFKISVKMDTTGKASTKEKVTKRAFKEIELTSKYIDVIKELQKDIEITKEPFKKIIDKLNISYEELFSIAKIFKESGVMRRYATILNHRIAGFNANAMSVWEVPEDRAEEIGKQLATFSAVSHCYLRPSYPNWKYNIFAMVHAKSEDESNALIEQMAKECGLTNYTKLYSTKEFKKERIIYFSDEFKKWEDIHYTSIGKK